MAAMAATAHDNVIRFPDATRDHVIGADRAPTFKTSRDLLAQKLREAWRALLPEIDEEMLTRGDLADERELRNLYYGAHEILQQNAVRLESLLAANWLRLFDAAVRRGDRPKAAAMSSDLDELQLVEFGDVDEDLAVKAIASLLRDGCEDGLFAVGRRMAYLSGRDEGTIAVADLLAEALHVAVTDIGFSVPARLEQLRAIGRHAVRCLVPPIHEVNAFLVGRDVLPKLRRTFSRPPAGKPRTAMGAAADSGEVFAMLQRLVSSGVANGVVPAPVSGPAGAMAAGSFGVRDSGVSMATMALAMERVMTSLDALQRSMPPAVTAAPTTNLLREFRNSDAGQSLGHLDAVTADIVATLFDFIFDDPAIADPIKALIGRMQIPVLKVAMLDKSFFSSKAHPARRLLDGISRAAVRCGPSVGREDPLYARVAQIIEHLQHDFKQDAGLFGDLCVELDTFLDGQEATADEQAAKAAPLVAAQEQREMAALAADQALAGWLAMPLPVAVADLLSNEWRSRLVRHYLDGDNDAWTAAIGTVADLVASVQPQPDVRERRLLAARLPILVKRIHDGLNSAQVADDRRMALIDGLFSLHTAILRGGSPEIAPAMPAAPAPTAEPEIASEVIEEGDTRVDNVSLLNATPRQSVLGDFDAVAEVADLKRGDWVEFNDAEHGFVRYRLAWISPQRGILLFTNPQSPRALAIAPAALALQIGRGDAEIMSCEPIFDRAMNRALESLKAA
jgi:hypothetical protein